MNAAAETLLLLPGLREDNPRDFLAALGFLRLISLQWPELDAKLSWEVESGTPRLHISAPLPENWCAVLVQSLQELATDPSKPLFHGEVIKTSPEAFRLAAEKSLRFARDSAHPLRSLAPLLYAAYSSQNEDKDGLHISAFSFGNGQSGKKLLLDISQLIDTLAPDDLRDSLAGTLAPVSAKSLRWNPNEFRAAAYRSHDPGKGIKGDDSPDLPAFNILAFFGLTFFPSLPRISGGITSGIHRHFNGGGFEWPIWEAPLGTDSVASLVVSQTGGISFPGVIHRWRSRRFSSDKSLYFAPAFRMS